jgi:hypothetical protein
MIILSFGTVKQILLGYSTAAPHFPITPSPEKPVLVLSQNVSRGICSPLNTLMVDWT